MSLKGKEMASSALTSGGAGAGLLLAGLATATLAGDRAQSEWVWEGENGRLAYQHTESGDRIPDFSHAGYRGGGVAIPDVPAVLTLEPADGDDTQRLQAAIEEVASRPLGADGFRGAILLKAGVFELSESIHIRHSGIVLRGEGQEHDETTLLITGRSDAFWSRAVEVTGPQPIEPIEATRTAVIDDYVPVGTHELEVEDASGLNVGDRVIVDIRKNEQWIRDLGMDILPGSARGTKITQWEPDKFVYRYERGIASVDGNRVTLDAPLADAIDRAHGQATVVRVAAAGRIENVGIENLRAIARIDSPRHEDGSHYRVFIWMGNVRNAWIRDVTSYHFGFGQAMLSGASTAITVQDCRAMDPAARIAGSRRYAFYLSGQLALVQRCFANESRHPFSYNAYAAGPNVFLDCEAQDSLNDSGPHHRWATAGLMDNVRTPDGTIRIQNRLIMGGGHGWAGANFVVWNCQAASLTVHSPPIAQNWVIGSVGRKLPPVYADPETFRQYTVSDRVDEQGQVNHPAAWGFDDAGDRHWDSLGSPVWPASLYLQQLRDRLGEQAVANIADRPYSFSSASKASKLGR